MDKTTLVEKSINEGKRLIESLDKAGLIINAAMWFYLSDTSEWRLFLASPLVDKDGPKKAYSSIQAILESLSPPSEISLKEISVVSPSHQIIRLLKIAIHTGPGISGIRFTQNVINNTLIEDAYIYRIT
jgi:hypothetical protein